MQLIMLDSESRYVFPSPDGESAVTVFEPEVTTQISVSKKFEFEVSKLKQFQVQNLIQKH
jgi:hypothetical protein